MAPKRTYSGRGDMNTRGPWNDLPWIHCVVRSDLNHAYATGTQVEIHDFIGMARASAGLPVNPAEVTDHDRHTLIDCLLSQREHEYDGAEIIANFNDGDEQPPF